VALIKRYSNRKLYDTEAKRYITLEGIAELIRKGKEVHVIDHTSGEDLTAMIQAQIIFEQERKLKGGLPRSVLTGLIQTGSDTLGHLRRALIRPADWNAQIDAEIERRVQALIQQGGLSKEEGLRLLDKLLALGEPSAESDSPNEQEIERMLKRSGLPSRAEVQELARRVEALATELEKLPRPAAAKAKRSTK